MAIRTVAELLDCLAKREVKASHRNEPGLMDRHGGNLWDDLLREERSLHQEIVRTPGASKLAVMCQAEGHKFTDQWVGRERAKLILSGQLTEAAVSKMPVAKFAARLLESRAPAEAYEAYDKKLFPKGLPDDQNLVDAIVRLESNRTKDNTDREIIREFMGESRRDCPKTIKLLSQVRRAQGDGRTTLPKRTKRTAKPK